jgi:cellulose synthase/poly-beta-1,6-N-acetylglucosamine synthase-like glycosyltransferase
MLRLKLNGTSPWVAKQLLRDARRKLADNQERLKHQRHTQKSQMKQMDWELEELRRRLAAAQARSRLLRQTQAREWIAQSVPETMEEGRKTSAPPPSSAASQPASRVAAPRPRLGDALINHGHLTQEQLDEAIARQEEFGGRLGDILIEMGYVTAEILIPYFSSPSQKSRLGDMLLQSGLLTQMQLDKALAFQRKSGGMLGDILLSLRFLEPEDLYRIIANQNQIGRVGNTVNVDSGAKLAESLAREYGVVIIHQYSNRFLVAVNDPLTTERKQELEQILELPVEQVLASKNEMELFWGEAYNREMLHESTMKLATEQPHNSASRTFTRPQLISAAVAGLILGAFLIWEPLATLIALNVGVQIFYFFMTLFKFAIIMYGSRSGSQYRFTEQDIANIDERDLPVYTILVPMYKESEVIPHLIGNLEKLDYPKAKLDVRLLIEKDDVEAQTLLQRLRLPPYYTVLVVPDSLPKTKPKACNFGIIRARGKYVVIYDAEDRPDPDQLKKVYLTFKACGEETACVQAKLNYFNSEQNLLTRWFTQEYSMWFELLLPGIMKLDVPIPLGGTSNHFKTDILKELNAWDPYNVTEDADLGVRLYKEGYKTAIVDSRTWEEANSRFGNWIRQRSRWIKGYMQTWLVHMRNPHKLVKEIGIKGFLGFQVMVLATPVIPLINPIYWIMIVLWYGWRADFIPQFFPGIIYYLSAMELYLANFFFIFSNIAGVYWVIHDMENKKQNFVSYRLVKYALLTPLYWAMMSIAAYKAAWQLVTKPFYWEKTVHGLDKTPSGAQGTTTNVNS